MKRFQEPALTPAQEAMLAASIRSKSKSNPPYYLQLTLPLRSSVNVSRWADAWLRLVRAEEILRLSYYSGNPETIDTVPEDRFTELVDCRKDSSQQFRWNVEARTRKQLREGFDCVSQPNTPLWRTSLYLPPEGEAVYWVLNIHHAIVDGYSINALVQKLLALYESKSEAIENSHFWSWSEELAARSWDDSIHFFDNCSTKPIQHGSLSSKYPYIRSHDVKPSSTIRVPLDVPAALVKELDHLSTLELAYLAQAAWGAQLSRTYGKEAVRFGVLRHCRWQSKYAKRNDLGPYAHASPMILEYPPDIIARDCIKKARATFQALKKHACCPLKLLRSGHEKSADDLIDTVVNVREQSIENVIFELMEQYLQHRPCFTLNTDIPLAVEIFTKPFFHGHIAAQEDLFTQESVEAIKDTFVGFLTAFATKPDIPAREIGLSPHFSNLISDTYPYTGVAQMFYQQVRDGPDKIALSSPDELWTRQHLFDVAQAYAAQFRKVPANKQTCIAILRGRSFHTVAAMLGALCTNRPFMVFHEEAEDRTKIELIRQSQADIVVCDETERIKLQQSHYKPVYCTCQTVQVVPQSTEPLIERSEANDRAYLVATSGTTGTPKIVSIRHGGLSNLIRGYQGVLQLTAIDKRYQATASGSDTFVMEVLLYLCNGAALHFDRELLKQGFTYFNAELEKHAMTVLGLPSSVWRLWAQTSQTIPSSLRVVVCSMEKTDAALLSKWRKTVAQKVTWINAYGPSEATCVATLFTLYPSDTTPQHTLPIGKPLPGVIADVRNAQGLPVPPRSIGEIWISGAGLAHGYLDDEEATTASFILDPISGQRCYKTGDLGYFDKQGELVFVGRIDHQVKVRGHRVEMEGVEHVMAKHPRIIDSAVVNIEPSGQAQLIGFYVSDTSLDEQALRSFLKQRLPSHAIPTYLFLSKKIPRSQLGKVQRHELRIEAKKRLNEESLKTADREPAYELQRQIIEVFSTVLHLSHISLNTNFFDVGGDSLSAIAVTVELEKLINIPLSAAEIFIYPTPLLLAKYLKEKTGKQNNNFEIQTIPLRETDKKAIASIYIISFTTMSLEGMRPFAESFHEGLNITLVKVRSLGNDFSAKHLMNLIARIARRIAEQSPDGRPIYVFGYSVDALIARATTVYLSQSHHTVGGTILLEPAVTMHHKYSLSLQIKLKLMSVSYRITEIAKTPGDKLLRHTRRRTRALLGLVKHSLNKNSACRASELMADISNEYARLRKAIMKSLEIEQNELPAFYCRSTNGEHSPYLTHYDAYWKKRLPLAKTINLKGPHHHLLKGKQAAFLGKTLSQKILHNQEANKKH